MDQMLIGSYIAQKRKEKNNYCVGGDEGSNVMDFISGVLLGISVVTMLVGVYVTVRGMAQKYGK